METQISPRKHLESLVKYEEMPIKADDLEASSQLGETCTTISKIDLKLGTDRILDIILPPREWIENGMHYKQYVSHEPALREDVKTLKESAVDEILKKRAAKKTGICNVRENIHMQLFDEVIRQITIDCVERGLLLHRVKEQEKMLLSSYQTLYQSAVIYGIRKKLQAEHGKLELQNKIEDLQKKKILLKNKETLLKNKKDEAERRIKEQNEIDTQRRKAEIDFLSAEFKRTTTFRDLAQKQQTKSNDS